MLKMNSKQASGVGTLLALSDASFNDIVAEKWHGDKPPPLVTQTGRGRMPGSSQAKVHDTRALKLWLDRETRRETRGLGLYRCQHCGCVHNAAAARVLGCLAMPGSALRGKPAPGCMRGKSTSPRLSAEAEGAPRGVNERRR
jgi:hypothetical protein